MSNFYNEKSRYGTYSTQWDFIQDRFEEANLLPFSISDTDFTIPDGTVKKLNQAVDRGFFGYTRWNHTDYKQAIISWFDKRFTTFINDEWIVYSPSVIYSLSTFIQLLHKEDKKVATFTPCYDAFFECVNQNECLLLEIPLIQIEENRIDFKQVEVVFKRERPSIFLLCNPHNPTGRAFSENELIQLIKLCNQYSVAIISDEIHMDVCRKNVQHHPIVVYIDLIDVPCVLLSSASKTFNSPGLGGSYALVPDTELRNKFLTLLKGRDGLSSIPYLSLLATMDCYSFQEGWVNELNKVIDENFNYLKVELKQHLNLDFTIPDATYLAWIDLNMFDFSIEELQKQLVHQEKVAMMRGDVYGEEGSGYLRFNLGAPKEKIIVGTERLIHAIQSLKENSQ